MPALDYGQCRVFDQERIAVPTDRQRLRQRRRQFVSAPATPCTNRTLSGARERAEIELGMARNIRPLVRPIGVMGVENERGPASAGATTRPSSTERLAASAHSRSSSTTTSGTAPIARRSASASARPTAACSVRRDRSHRGRLRASASSVQRSCAGAPSASVASAVASRAGDIGSRAPQRPTARAGRPASDRG